MSANKVATNSPSLETHLTDAETRPRLFTHGHTICLGHEQERFDRDKYLGFSNCDRIPRKRGGGRWTAKGIYDYSSQLHYDCNWCGGGWPKAEEVTKCGFEAGSGLSPLDVDKINELYDCQGCHRHRWRPANSLTDADNANMYNFGYKLKDDTTLYPCRAPVRWEVSPGRYDIDTKSCHIGGWEQTFVITEDVEVLTIPGGLNNKCSVYKLRNRAEVTRENGVVSSLSFRYTEARGYVAYGTFTTNDVTENALGKIWLWGFHNSFRDFDAELQVGSVTGFQKDYKVLTCSLDETCLLKKSCETSGTSTKRDWSKKMVCYVASWSRYRQGDGKFEPEDVNPHLCTHLVYSFAALENNVISSKDPWGDLRNETGKGHDGYRRFASLKKQNPELKTLIAIGGWSDGSKKYSEMVANSTTRRIFVESIIPFLAKHGFDGLDLDWEYPAHRGGNPEDKENFCILVKELREAFDRAGNGYLLTAAVSQNPRTIEKAYEVPKLARDLDFLNVMCYDYAGFWAGHNFTGHHTRLYRRPSDNKNSERYLSVNDTVSYWLQAGLPKEKLILGMAFYGRGFTLSRAAKHGLYASASGTIPPGIYSRQAGTWGYNEICKKFKEDGNHWKISINDHVKAPYAFNDLFWIGYEDVESIYYKADYARKMDLGGAMVWSLDKDDFKGKCHNQPYILLRTIVTTLNDKPGIPQRSEVVPEADDIEENETI